MMLAVRHLLQEIIDYAGLFPPASLSMEEAIRNFARYRHEPESWMLGRFICPTTKLSELHVFEDLFTGDPLRFSALIRKVETIDQCVSILVEDLAEIERFHQQRQGTALVDTIEMRLPDELVQQNNPEGSIRLLQTMVEIIGGSTARPAVFFEVDVRAMSMLSYLQPMTLTGFKLRCGGVEASAFPSPVDVAQALVEGAATMVPLKFTAGLHHPLRHFNETVQTKMHGFINVFIAGILTLLHGLRVEELVEVLEEEDAQRFRFSEDGVAFDRWKVSADQIEEIRRRQLISFGSCSFDEPREDLKKLGWIA